MDNDGGQIDSACCVGDCVFVHRFWQSNFVVVMESCVFCVCARFADRAAIVALSCYLYSGMLRKLVEQ